eukprot:gene29526-36783_t
MENLQMLAARELQGDISQNKFPHCSTAVSDIAGCMAMRCEVADCGKHFCAFCFRPAENVKDNHEHSKEEKADKVELFFRCIAGGLFLL